jgi:hypothetical protein
MAVEAAEDTAAPAEASRTALSYRALEAVAAEPTVELAVAL